MIGDGQLGLTPRSCPGPNISPISTHLKAAAATVGPAEMEMAAGLIFPMEAILGKR
jgi:hypothetical protein